MILSICTLSLLSVLCLLLYRLYLYPRYFSPLRTLPGPPLGPVVEGQFGLMLRSEAGIPQRQWVKDHGPVVRVVGPVGIERVITASHTALHKILVSDHGNYPKPGFTRNTLGLVAGYGLLTVEGKDHRQMRKAMNPAFGIQHLTAQVEMYYDPIESLVDILGSQIDATSRPQEGKVFLMYDWVSKTALDIICLTAFGYKTDSLHNPHNELAEAYEELLNLQTGQNLSYFIAFLSIPGAVRLLKTEWMARNQWLLGFVNVLRPLQTFIRCMRRIKSISADLLAEKIKDASSQSDLESKKDVMSILVRARIADMAETEGYMMSDQAMMDQVLTFLGAGHETTASGLAWTLWLLASHPDIQRRLRDETRAIFEATNGRPNYRQLKEMTFLDAVIMESLRLFPPVPMTFRRAEKTGYIDGALIPAGTLFYIPIRVVNTWKKIWGDDAEDFNPLRWFDLPPDAHLLTFIEGPHGCIGKTMAIVEMKAIIGALVNKFEFSPGTEGQVPIPTAAITMKPMDDMPLCVKRV